jgi:ABC-type thiamine transport system substrate-binding protein
MNKENLEEHGNTRNFQMWITAYSHFSIGNVVLVLCFMNSMVAKLAQFLK